MDVPTAMLGALANVAPAYASDDAIIAAAQRVSDTEGLAALGLGNAAVEGDIGMRPTLGGVNLFVFYAIYQVGPAPLFGPNPNPDPNPNPNNSSQP